MSRKCACPREEPMDGLPASIKYRHGDRCRKRAYRAKVKRAASDAGLQVAPTLSAVHAMGSPHGRDGHAENGRTPRKPRRVGLRISYRKALAAQEAGEPLSSVLTSRQLEQLDTNERRP